MESERRAENEVIGGGIFDGGDGGGVRAMMGGSLPPRKRLLAGLKQTGSWLLASTQASPTMPVTLHCPEGRGMEGIGAAESFQRPAGLTTADEVNAGCMSCGELESSSWTSVKGDGVARRLCSSCMLSFNKNMSCPHCSVLYPDVKDPAIWLQCCLCQRSVHVECLKKTSPSPQLYACTFLCPDCNQVKMAEDLANHEMETRGEGTVGRIGVHCSVEAGNSGSSAGAHCLNPCSKKSRVLGEAKSNPGYGQDADAGRVQRTCNESKTGLGRKVATTSQEAVAAAAVAAAALAGRTAAAAKATAEAKAAVAVKAAAAAKAALDAAALAARAEAQSRGELPGIFVLFEHSLGDGVHQCEVALSEMKKEGWEKPEKDTEEEVRRTLPSSIDDEKLARQLHRAINSSPRISRGLTPLRRKLSEKAGTVVDVSDSVRAWPLAGLCSAIEPRLQSKQQQSKPKSLPQKEVERFEASAVKRELKMLDDNRQSSLKQAVCPTDSADAGKFIVVDSEPADLSTVTLTRKDYRTMCEDAICAPLDVIAKVKINYPNSDLPQVSCGIEDDGHGRLCEADISQAAAMLDEVLTSEVDAEAAAEGVSLSRLGDGISLHLQSEVTVAPSSSVVEGTVSTVHSQGLEEGKRQIGDGGDAVHVDKSSGVACLPEVDCDAMEPFEVPGVAAIGTIVEGQWGLDSAGDELYAFHAREDLNQLSGGPTFLSRSVSGKQAEEASELGNSGNMSQTAGHGQPWQRATFKAMPGAGNSLRVAYL